ERMMAAESIHWTAGADQEQACWLLPSGEQRDQINGRRIAPVQVLEHEDERRFGRQRFDRLRHLSQHSFTRGPQKLSLQSVPLGDVEELCLWAPERVGGHAHHALSLHGPFWARAPGEFAVHGPLCWLSSDVLLLTSDPPSISEGWATTPEAFTT